MLQALRDFDLAGQVFLVGHDASDASLKAVRNGEIQGLLVTNPYKMGFLAVTTLVDHTGWQYADDCGYGSNPCNNG